MTKRRKLSDPGLLPEQIMRRMLAAAIEFQRLRPWETIWDTVFVGCRDERTRQLRICSVLGAAGEVFGMVSYRGHEGIGLAHALLTQDSEPSPDQFLNGMNCLKLDFSLKRELTQPDLARLKAVAYKPPGTGHVWPVFQSMRPSWAPWPVDEEEAIQLTDDLRKVARFVHWFGNAKHIYESHPRAEIPVVGSGDLPLTSEEIDWMPLLPPAGALEDVLTLTGVEAETLRKLPVRAESVSEVAAALFPPGAFVDETGMRRVPRTVIMSDRASYFVQAVEMFSGDEMLRNAVRKVVLQGMTKHKLRPQRIHVSDDRLLQILKPACALIDIEVERVDKLVAVPDALESLAQHLRGALSR